MTGALLAQAILEMIGAYSPADGDVSASDQETVLRHANLWRKSRNAKHLALAAIERQSITWTANQSSRTIGAAGQLVGTRPEAVLMAKVIPVGQTSEVPVYVMTHEEYASISQKSQEADYFTRLLYERTGAEVGTLTVWPKPTTAPTLLLHNKVPLTSFEADSLIAINEEYEAALVSQIAKRCATIFGKPWTQELESIAREDWAIVQRANARLPEAARMPAGFPGGRGGVSDTAYDSGRF